MNPYIIEIMVKERQKEIQEEARRRHLLAIYDAARPSAREKLLLSLGKLLIAMGAKLTSRYGYHLQLSVETLTGTKSCRYP